MKIIHYALGMPPYRTGGLTKYAVDLMLHQKQQGDDVMTFYPAEYNFFSKSTKINYEYSYQGIGVFKMVNPLPVPLLGGVSNPVPFMKSVINNNFINFLDEVKPEVIHIHTLMGLPKEFLSLAKQRRIRTIFTTHDYYGLCPKVNMLDQDNQICTDFNNGIGCVNCNYGRSYSVKQIKIMQSATYRKLKDSRLVKMIRQVKKEQHQSKNKELVINSSIKKSEITSVDYSSAEDYKNLRDFYLDSLMMVDEIHYNSSVAKEMYRQFLDKEGRMINITHGDINDHRRLIDLNPDKVQLAYLGPIADYKGFYSLCKILNQLKSRGITNWHLHIHGDNKPAEANYDPGFFSFHGKYTHNQLDSILRKVNLLIIPSKWKETYGFIGLEAMSYGVPILLSDNVGFKDVIKHGVNGLVCENEEIEANIEYLLEEPNILKKMNENIVHQTFEDLLIYSHSKEVQKIYKNIQ